MIVTVAIAMICFVTLKVQNIFEMWETLWETLWETFMFFGVKMRLWLAYDKI